MISLYENKRIRMAMSDLFATEFDGGGRSYDIELVIDTLKYIEDQVNKDQHVIVLKETNMWSEAGNVIDETMYALGYSWSEELSDMEGYVWTFIKN